MNGFTELSDARDAIERADAIQGAWWYRADGRRTLLEGERDHLLLHVTIGQRLRGLRIDVGDAGRLADVLPSGVL